MFVQSRRCLQTSTIALLCRCKELTTVHLSDHSASSEASYFPAPRSFPGGIVNHIVRLLTTFLHPPPRLKLLLSHPSSIRRSLFGIAVWNRLLCILFSCPVDHFSSFCFPCLLKVAFPHMRPTRSTTISICSLPVLSIIRTQTAASKLPSGTAPCAFTALDQARGNSKMKLRRRL